MLTPAQLERATPGYRRGYNDALNYRKPMNSQDIHGVWTADDYAEGYRAGKNDADAARAAWNTRVCGECDHAPCHCHQRWRDPNSKK